MKRYFLSLIWLPLLVMSVACGSSGSGDASNGSPAVFVTGEDAPLPTVVSFNITLNTITLTNQSGKTVTVLSQATTVDFGRLMGLRSLLGFSSVPAGTYTSATFNMASPIIDYINLSANPPSLGTMNGTLTNSSVTVSFPQAMVVGNNGLAGLHMDFDLRDSLQTDQTGQITGMVNPVITIAAVSATDEEGEITDFTGALVSTDTMHNTFRMQGPWGFQETIAVNAQTQYNGTFSLTSLPTDGIISVVGRVQADGSILARAVEVVTTDAAFISGRILQLTPSSGPVQNLTMFIGEELPAMSGNFARGQVLTFDVSQVTNYDVCFIDNWLTNFVFNSSSLVAGQRIFVGGTWDSTTATFTPDMISLRRQGVVGQLTPNSVSVTNGNQGSFKLQNDGLLGWVAQGPFTVNTSNGTTFINVSGLSGLSSATPPITASGLVLDVAGQPQVYAQRVAVRP